MKVWREFVESMDVRNVDVRWEGAPPERVVPLCFSSLAICEIENRALRCAHSVQCGAHVRILVVASSSSP